MSRRPRRWPSLLFVVVVALLVAGVAFLATRANELVDGDDDSGATGATWPLRGTAVAGDDTDAVDRPALAVKIDDTSHGRPQAGLAEADVVFEEQVEGGLTRLLAVFHSADPSDVGPVRSARSTDLGVLAELARPLFAWSGANPTFRASVEAADVVDVGYSAAPDAYRRVDDRRAPYNLFATPAELRSEGADGHGQSPPVLFSYRADDEPVAGPGQRATDSYRAATTATTIEWTWDAESGTWLRAQDGTPHVDADGRRVRATNVLVRTTPYRDSGVRDSRGAVVPEAVLVGQGDALLLSDGKAVPARWRKPSADAPTTYTRTDGEPLLLTPGTTWVEVLPPR